MANPDGVVHVVKCVQNLMKVISGDWLRKFASIENEIEEFSFLSKFHDNVENLFQPTAQLLKTHHCTAVQNTKVYFASFLSFGFTTMAVINPPERKLSKRTSVHCTLRPCGTDREN